MEDSSVLKVRSDLYPHGPPSPSSTSTGAMTSTPVVMAIHNKPNCAVGTTSATNENSEEKNPRVLLLTTADSPRLATTVTTPPCVEGPHTGSESPLDYSGAASSWSEERNDGLDVNARFENDARSAHSLEHLYGRYGNVKSTSEDATPPMTPTGSDGVQELPCVYSEARSGGPPVGHKVVGEQKSSRRSPVYSISPIKGQSSLVNSHGLSFISGGPTNQSNGETSRPPPTPPDEAPISYAGLHSYQHEERPESKPRIESPKSTTDEQTATETIRGTLDLSTSSQSRDSTFPLRASQAGSSPAISPSSSAFSPFNIFPGLARIQDLNPPMFGTDRLEASVPKNPYNSSLYAANLRPHLLPWLISSQIQNLVNHQHQASSVDGGGNAMMSECNGGNFLPEDKDQQPLDLSAKKHDLKPPLGEDLVAKVLDMKPSTRGRRRADNSKRSYTEDELHAALRDIQSGKLGTRRAAVIYGIPRSTLRNKVYKLQSVNDHNKKMAEQKERMHSILPDSTAQVHPTTILSNNSGSDPSMESSCEALKLMIKSKMHEKLEELSRNSQTPLTGGDKEKLLDSALAHLYERIPKLALDTNDRTKTFESLSSLSLYPQLRDFTHKVVEERFYEEIKKINNNFDEVDTLRDTNGYKFENFTPPLSIPSYRSACRYPSSSDPSLGNEDEKGNSSHPSIGSPPQTNLKDMIAQIINQKLLNDIPPGDIPTQNSSTPFLPLSVQCMDSPATKTGLTFQGDEKSQQEQSKKRSKSPSSSGGGKGSRPKRGKYRNYDRDNLLKAVQAVQSGEMSVHRAGSFYGVPHSTLEYKVKERHLNRGRNKKEPPSTPNTPLLKTGQEINLSGGPLSSTGFTQDHFKKDHPDIVNREASSVESCANDEISVLRVQSPPKKGKTSVVDMDEPFCSLQIPPTPFLSNPFPFWNNTSPILSPFLPPAYQPEHLYASRVMSNLQKVAASSTLNSTKPRGKSPTSEGLQEPLSVEGTVTRGISLFPNGGHSTSTPPSSPTTPTPKDGLLNSLLRNKIKTQINENSIPWPMPLPKIPDDGDQKERTPELGAGGGISPTGLFTLKALLPSFIAAKTSFAAAAFHTDANSSNASKVPSSSPPATSLPLLKGTSHIPVVGGESLSETP